MKALLKLSLSLCLGLGLLAGGPPTVAQEAEEAVSGRELLAGCEEGRIGDNPNQYCMQYVFGLIQTVIMLQQMGNTDQQLFCIDPKAVSLQKVTMDVTTWLQNARNRLDEDAYVLVTEALHDKYPCERV